MHFEFDFELKPRRLAQRWVALSCVLLAASVTYSGVVLCRSHSALRDARAEVEQLQWRLQNQSPSASASPPPYAKDAYDALRLLQWPFDKALRELEHCLPDVARLTALQVDGITREAQATAELPGMGKDANFDELVACLNDGRDVPAWRISQIAEAAGSMPTMGATGAVAGGAGSAGLLVSLRRKDTQ
jgi:hypothetical protein